MPDHYHIIIKNGLIQHIQPASLNKLPASDLIIDAKSGLVMPAFIEGHNHFVAHALQRAQCNLAPASNATQGFEIINQFAAKYPDEFWIRGGGWSLERWGRDAITKENLDQIIPDRPAVFESQDFHSVWINSRAQELLGIPDNVNDNPPDNFGRSTTGRFNGVLFEEARMIVYDKVPLPSKKFLSKALKDNMAYYLSSGFVHAITMDGVPEMKALLDVVSENSTMRFSWFFPWKKLFEPDFIDWLHKINERKYVKAIGAKFFVDGSFGSLTALMKEPFLGTSDYGVQNLSIEDLRKGLSKAIYNRYGAAIHAIGDQAISLALDQLEALKQNYTIDDSLPLRLEHVQIPSKSDLDRLAKLNLAVAVQPCHIEDDIPMIGKWLRDRKEQCYPLHQFEKRNIDIIMGSDAPVKEIDPWTNIFWGVRQYSPEGKNYGLNLSETITLETALKGYTATAARYSGFPDSGMISPGTSADLILLNMSYPEFLQKDQLLDSKVVMTIFEGEIVYNCEDKI